MGNNWKYDEFQQIGKDYSQKNEVDIYEQTHSQFRDIEKESKELLSFLRVSTNDILVDFGSGTGVFAIEASKICKKVYAVDISKEMLKNSSNKATKHNISNIEFVHSGFLNFKTSKETIDYVTTTFSFHHLPDYWKGIALENIYKMLKGGGVLYIKDVIIECSNSRKNIQEFIDKQEDLGGDFLRDDASTHFKEEYSTYDWIIEGLLSRAGFIIQSKKFTDGLIAEYYCIKEKQRKY